MHFAVELAKHIVALLLYNLLLHCFQLLGESDLLFYFVQLLFKCLNFLLPLLSSFLLALGYLFFKFRPHDFSLLIKLLLPLFRLFLEVFSILYSNLIPLCFSHTYTFIGSHSSYEFSYFLRISLATTKPTSSYS